MSRTDGGGDATEGKGADQFKMVANPYGDSTISFNVGLRKTSSIRVSHRLRKRGTVNLKGRRSSRRTGVGGGSGGAPPRSRSELSYTAENAAASLASLSRIGGFGVAGAGRSRDHVVVCEVCDQLGSLVAATQTCADCGDMAMCQPCVVSTHMGKENRHFRAHTLSPVAAAPGDTCAECEAQTTVVVHPSDGQLYCRPCIAAYDAADDDDLLDDIDGDLFGMDDPLDDVVRGDRKRCQPTIMVWSVPPY